MIAWLCLAAWEIVTAIVGGWAVFMVAYGFFWAGRWFVTAVKTGDWGDENYRTSVIPRPAVSGLKKERLTMSITMRAKMQVNKVERFPGSDRITCNAVAAKAYPADGSDEDNTYAKFSPSGELTLSIANPVLLGVIHPGQKFYLDFTPATE